VVSRIYYYREFHTISYHNMTIIRNVYTWWGCHT
jgi:hypothetical protein